MSCKSERFRVDYSIRSRGVESGDECKGVGAYFFFCRVEEEVVLDLEKLPLPRDTVAALRVQVTELVVVFVEIFHYAQMTSDRC